MSTSYTQKMLRSITFSKDDLYKSFINCSGLQLRDPVRARYAPEECAKLLQESYELLLAHTPGAITTTVERTDRSYILHTIMDDQPFIVDTVRMHLQSIGASNISGYNIVVRLEKKRIG